MNLIIEIVLKVLSNTQVMFSFLMAVTTTQDLLTSLPLNPGSPALPDKPVLPLSPLTPSFP